MNFPTTDQRGISRPQGALADSGGVEVELSQAFQSFSAQGGDGSIEVFAPGRWTATSNDPSWVTITSASGDSGNGTLTFSVAPHSGSSSRRTTLTINDETFTVLQGANSLEAQAGSFLRSTIIRVGSAGRGPTRLLGSRVAVPVAACTP